MCAHGACPLPWNCPWQTAIWRGGGPLLACWSMTGRRARAFPGRAVGRVCGRPSSNRPRQLSVSLDGGTGFARAYIVTEHGGQYAIAGAGAGHPGLQHLDRCGDPRRAGSGPSGPSRWPTSSTARHRPTSWLRRTSVRPARRRAWTFPSGTPTRPATSFTSISRPNCASPDGNGHRRDLESDSNLRRQLEPAVCYEQDITFTGNGAVSTGRLLKPCPSTRRRTVVGMTFDGNNNGLLLSRHQFQSVHGDAGSGTGHVHRRHCFAGYSSPALVGTARSRALLLPTHDTPGSLPPGRRRGLRRLRPQPACRRRSNIVLSSVQVAAVGGRQTQPSCRLGQCAGQPDPRHRGPTHLDAELALGSTSCCRATSSGMEASPSRRRRRGPTAVPAGSAGRTPASAAGPDAGIPAIPIIPPGQGQLTGHRQQLQLLHRR